MKLRKYQQEASDSVCRELADNGSTLVVLPTGTGKTVLFADVVRRFQPARALVFAHREELVFQARDKIQKFTGIECGVEMGQFRTGGEFFGTLPPVVVSTVQTLASGGDGGGRMTKFDPDAFGLVVVDEAHHAVKQSYRKVLDYFRTNPKCKVLGVTATPDRADEEALGQVFETVAYNYEIIEAIDDGWLVPVEQKMVSVSTLDLSQCRTTAGDLNGADLAAVMEEEENLHGVAIASLETCGERRAIVFAVTVKQAERLAEIFNRYKPNCASWICGETQKDERRAKLRSFADGAFQFMVNVGILTEGFDDSGVEVVVMARPTKSRALYAQMAGRGTRPKDSIAGELASMNSPEERRNAIAGSGKPFCEILDFAGNSGRHKLVTAVDILGGKVSDEVVEMARRKIAEAKGPVNVQEVLKEMDETKREMDERKAREAAMRDKIRGRVKFSAVAVDPFAVFQLQPVKARGWDHGRVLSEKQRNILMRQGIDPDGMPYGQAKQLLDEIFRRWNGGLSSFGQTKILARNGIRAPMRREEAARMIDQIAQRQGWRRNA